MIKQTMINTMKRDKFDNLYTPRYAVVPLLDLLPENKIIWECCDPGTSEISTFLREYGFKVVSTDVETGQDFLTYEPDFDFDIIVTNPPYSIKTKFLEKCYSYNKPFALLLPLTTFEGIERGKLFREHGISVTILDERVGFLKEKHNPWFNSSWFHWGLTENNRLIFYKLERK